MSQRKPRGNSDLSSQSGGCHSLSMPAAIDPRKLALAEPYPSISASALLGQDVSHSGWIRKEGLSVRTWRHRFMILHHGCLYYFKKPDSNTPKGKFSLNGYRCEAAPERENADRYPYTFKLVHGNDENRTYYFSSPSKSEKEGWIHQINTDIKLYCSGAMNPDEMYDYVDAAKFDGSTSKCPTLPKVMPPVPPSRRECKLNGGMTCVKSAPAVLKKPPKPAPVIPDDDDDSGEDSDYEPIDDVRKVYKEGQYVECVSDSARVPDMNGVNRGVRPIPPDRPGRKSTITTQEETSDQTAENDQIYLEVVASDHDKVLWDEYVRSRESERKGAPKPPPKPRVPPPTPHRSPSPRPPEQNTEDDEKFDFLPDGCVKPDLHKNQAKVFLELGRHVGGYIIHGSQSNEKKRVLSVWMSNGIKHYLVFNRDIRQSSSGGLLNFTSPISRCSVQLSTTSYFDWTRFDNSRDLDSSSSTPSQIRLADGQLN